MPWVSRQARPVVHNFFSRSTGLSRTGTDTQPGEEAWISVPFPRGPAACAGLRSSSFNSRAREGRDDVVRAADVDLVVSIHAPARGATWPHATDAVSTTRFNSRAREGRDNNGQF